MQKHSQTNKNPEANFFGLFEFNISIFENQTKINE